jgi:hypothetical protein
LLCAIVCGLATLGIASAARAEDPKPAFGPAYSKYELETIRTALARTRARLDPAPDGKWIESIDFLPLDVIEERDPVPEFLNKLHITTTRSTLDRIVVVSVGERFRRAWVEESTRKLRSKNRQLSLVVCLALQGSSPDRVKLLFVTKDIWSIRLNFDGAFGDGKLQSMYLQPSEENLLGQHKTVAATFRYDLDRVAVGGKYSDGYLFGTQIGATLDLNFYFNHHTGDPEGTFGSFSYGQALVSSRSEWGWGLGIGWDYQTLRRYVGGFITTYDDLNTANNDLIPWIYSTDVIGGNYSVTRAFGSTYRHEITLGIAAVRKVYSVPDLSVYNQQAVASFVATQVPVSDSQNYPFLAYHTFENRYMTVLNVDSLALQEDVGLGYDASVRLFPVTTALRSTRNFFGVRTGFSYTVPLRDGFARVGVDTETEFTNDGIPDGMVEVGLRVVTPRFPLGRLVLASHLVNRYENYLNVKSTLGGDTRLRGYPSGAFIGNSLFAANLEYRSRPLQLFRAFQLAGVLFFDTGCAFDTFADAQLLQGLGFGARLGIPQLNRQVIRADWGFPITPGFRPLPGEFPGNIILTFGQAF